MKTTIITNTFAAVVRLDCVFGGAGKKACGYTTAATLRPDTHT